MSFVDLKHMAMGVVALGVWGCTTAPPKQVGAPRIEDSGDQDMEQVPDKEVAPATKSADEMTPKEKQQACCKQCLDGLAKDRTGQKADAIPCADFTADLKDWCLDFFRTKPMKASECK